MTKRMTILPLRALLAALALFMLTTIAGLTAARAVDKGPFGQLLGSWGGGGMASYQDGSKERLSCTAYYTGGGTQLRLAIQCKSPSHNIHMRGSVSASGGRLSGQWEERTFNVGGSLSGRVAGNKISMSVGGNMQGSMNVSYTGNRQSVAIATGGSAPLRSVNMSLSRR
jgi:hypothetical protein